MFVTNGEEFVKVLDEFIESSKEWWFYKSVKGRFFLRKYRQGVYMQGEDGYQRAIVCEGMSGVEAYPDCPLEIEWISDTEEQCD